MIKFKKIGAFVMACAVAFTSMGLTGTELVKAANDEVVVKYVNNEQAFRDYIDDNAMPIVDRTVDADGKGDIRSFTIEEEGTLLLACVNDESDYCEAKVYANSSLTALVLKHGSEYITEDFASVSVKPGKYYLRAERWNGHGKDAVIYSYTYVGFIPKSGKIKASGKKTETVDKANVVNVKTMDKVSDLDAYIRNDGAASSTDYLGFFNSSYKHGPVHKFTVDSDGWIVLAAFEEDEYVDMHLYSNVDCSNRYLKRGATEQIEDKSYSKVYVKAGTYYYRAERWNGHGGDGGTNTTCYVGFIPTKNRIVANVKYNADKTAATVTFTYDSKYVPKYDLNNFIRVESGAVQPRHISNEDIWHTDDKDNALDTPVFKVTKNGTFTARIENSKDDCYGMVTFTVSGIQAKAQNITVKAAKTSLKASALKKKGATVKLTVKGAKTALTYKLTAGNKKYASISKKGVITFKKGTKKGTYKFSVTAKQAKGYKKTVKNVTIKVK